MTAYVVTLSPKNVTEVAESHECKFATQALAQEFADGINAGDFTVVASRPELEITITVSEPRFAKSTHLTKADVWGKIEEDASGSPRKLDNGMVIAFGGQRCPIYHDVVPSKSVTVFATADFLEAKKATYDDVAYWLEFVLGAGCVRAHGFGSYEGRDEFGLFIRADYKCW